MRPASALAAVLLAAGAAPGAASGAPYDGSQAFDAYSGVLVSSGRVVGLGGAFVGVGEGIGGVSVNPASVAQRDRHDADTWSAAGVLTWLVPRPDQLGDVDLANDGKRDGGLASSGALLLGAGGRAGRLGAGVLVQLSAVGADRTPTQRVTISRTEGSLAAGWSGWRDAVVLGASVTTSAGRLDVGPPAGPVTDTMTYADVDLRLGALWRPRGERFRLGLAFRPRSHAVAQGDRASFPIVTPAEFEFPWVLALGASAWIGPNARRYNEPPPVARERHPEWGEGPEYEPSPRLPVLLSVQLDVVGSTPGAVSIESALLQPGEVERSGERASLAVRAGVEWEAWPRWMRLRGGGYLEPSRAGAPPRLHGTFGFEVRVPCWPWDLQVGATGDVAPLYQNVSLSMGFWGDYGPVPPPRGGAPRA